MISEIVDLCLLIVAKVACPQPCAAPFCRWADVECDHLPIRRGRDDGGGNDVAVLAASVKYLIIRLLVIR